MWVIKYLQIIFTKLTNVNLIEGECGARAEARFRARGVGKDSDGTEPAKQVSYGVRPFKSVA